MADIRILSTMKYTPRNSTIEQLKPWYISKARGALSGNLVKFWLDYPDPNGQYTKQDPWAGTFCDDVYAVSRLLELLDFSDNPNNSDAAVEAFGKQIKADVEPYVIPYLNGTKIAQRAIYNRNRGGAGTTAQAQPTQPTQTAQTAQPVDPNQPPVQTPAQILAAEKTERTRLAKQFTNFMSGVHIVPSPRMANTVSHRLRESEKNAKNYLVNYTKLIDNGYSDVLEQQVKSTEFETWLKDLAKLTPTDPINKRLAIYFGGPGTGKTTRALKESNDRYIGCNSSMYPADLMEYYDVKNGVSNFKHSILWESVEQGLTLTLDEINLLSLECLRFLQTLLDNKSTIWYKGDHVVVHPDFKIIGTMNLEVNGVTYGLPEPLVDRAATLEEFKGSPEILGQFF